MTFQEKQLESIAQTLGDIDQSLKQFLNICRAGKAAPTVGDDCSGCWCSTCRHRENCKVKSNFGSPCNGCRPGQRFMAIGQQQCRYYKER